MKQMWTIFRKELRRFFTDSRMLMALFLPGALIFCLYSILGNFLVSGTSNVTNVSNTTYKVAYTDNSNSNTVQPRLLTYLDAYVKVTDTEKTNKLELTPISKEEVTTYRNKVQNKEMTLLLVFSDNFETDIYDETKASTTTIEYVYQSEDKASSHLYSLSVSLFNEAYAPIYYQAVSTNLGKANYASNQILSMLIPMLTVSLLYSTVISICPETFAGEKERGTLTSLLLTPMKRGHLVTGKILALSVVGGASGLFSFLGMALSLPKMFEGAAVSLSPLAIFLLFVLIITTLLLFVAFGTLVSALTKDVKEATSYLGPLTVVFMLLAMVPAFTNSTNIGFSFIPVVNMASISMSIVSGSVNYLFFAMTILTNVIVAGLFVFITVRAFRKERFIVN